MLKLLKKIKLKRKIKKYRKAIFPFAVGAVVILIPILYLSFNKPNEAQAAWKDTDWAFRKKFVIDADKVSGSSDHTDFPVLVNITDPDLVGRTQADGDDIMFTTSDGTTKLDHEIETFDSTTGRLAAWVEVGTLSYNSDTTLFMYYGNNAATDQSNATGTWNAAYEAVWHMSEASGTRADSTDGGLDLTSSGGVDQIESLIGYGGDFEDDDAGDYLYRTEATAGALDIQDGTDFTFLVIVKTESTSDIGRIITKEDNNTDKGYFMWNHNFGGAPHFSVAATNNGSTQTAKRNETYNSNGETNFNDWFMLTYTFDDTGTGATMGAWINDSEDSRAFTGNIWDSSQDFVVGATIIGGTDFFHYDGIIDEIQFSSTLRSDDWIITQYNNILSNETFFASIEEQESQTDALLYWKFDEGRGTTANDSAGQNHAGTISGATWQQSDSCISEKCLYFDGDADYVTIADHPDLDFVGSDSFTLQAWVKHPQDLSNSETIFNKYVAASGGGYRVSWSASGDITFGIDDDGTSFPEDSVSTTTSDYEDSEWHLVTAVKNGTSNIQLYVDGKLIGTDSSLSATGSLANSNALYIGSQDTTNNEFKGFIDEVKIYPYARSESQVLTDYSGGLGGPGGAAVFGAKDNRFLNDGLVGYWAAEEVGENTCSGGINDYCDSSGNANDGAFNGTFDTFLLGKFGHAAGFDGTADYISVTDNSSISPTEEVTMAAWLRPTTSVATDAIMVKHQSYAMTTNGSSIPQCSIWNGTSYDTATGTNALSLNTDTHVACTYNGETISVYVNGVLEGTAASSVTIPDNTNALRVGDDEGGTWGDYQGEMDDIRLYNRALSGSEITSLYNWSPAPIVHFSFDENTGGTAYDRASNLSGSFDGTPQWIPGKFGSALQFNGTTDSVDATSTSISDLLEETDYSLSAWVYLTSTLSDYANVIVMEDSGTLNSDLGFQSDRTFGTFYSGQCYSTNALPINEWHHIAVSYDSDASSGTVRIYLDGVNVDTCTTVGAPPLNQNTLTIGALANNTEEFPGYIDEVKIYNYTRTSAQIIEDMNGGHPVGGSPIGSQIAWLKFDELSGTTTYDSVNSYNATLDNNATWSTSGKFDGAMQFDGDQTGDGTHVEFADDSFDGYTEGAVALWFKPDDTGDSFQQMFGISDGTGGFNNAFELAFNSSNDTIDVWTQGCDATSYSANGVISGNVADWHHVVFSVDANGHKMYLDGQHIEMSYDVGDETDSCWIDDIDEGTTNYTIGCGLDSATGCYDLEMYEGLIDDFQLFSSALTQEQVQIVMNGNSAINFGKGNDAADDVVDGAGADPIAYYPFNENVGTSTTLDLSGNGYDGTLTSITNSDWVPGVNGSALNFDGTADDVTISDTSNLRFDSGSQDFSISFWVKRDGTGSEGVIGKFDGGNDGYGFRFLATDIARFEINALDLDTTNAVDDNHWHHVAVSIDRDGTGYIYLDGIQEGTLSVGSEVMATTANITIGDNVSSTNFDGKLDEVKFFDYALTPAQVAYDYNRGQPIGWWKFDECQGTTAFDSSGNSVSGTITPGGSGDNTTAGTCSSGAGDEMWDNGTNGKFNASLHFDGTNDHVLFSENSTMSSTTSNFSSSAWIYIDPAAASANHYQILSTGKSNSFYWGYRIRTDFTIEFYEDGGTAVTSSDTVSKGVWHNVTVVKSGDTGTNAFIYLDGRLVASGSIGTTPASAGTPSIGARTETSPYHYFDGQIDDVRIYSYPLSPSQISKIMNESAARFGP